MAISSKKYLALPVALLLGACGSSRNVVEGGERTHPKNFSLKTEHGVQAIAAQFTSCRLCHGEALTGIDGLGPSCASCHQQQGFANWQSNCTFCHGTEQVAAFDPATDLAKAAPATGSHPAHVNGTILAKGLSCEQCHPAVTSLAHIDGKVEVQLGALAATDLRDGEKPTYAGGTCSSVYCHGNGVSLEGAARKEVTWGGASMLCGDCHNLTPKLGGAVAGDQLVGGHAWHTSPSPAPAVACQRCHQGYGMIDLEHHVNGVGEAVLPKDGTIFTSFEGTAASSNCEACHAKNP
ncbi:MAG: CxxxxCH/CxxCH domain-containing protein [Anaeromyxobacteraceae bacterium]